MKRAVGFSYLNAEKEIPRCLDPWYPHVDYLICVDGRYQTPMPPKLAEKYSKEKYSTDYSDHVLKTRYADKLVYEQFSGNQLDKRQRCLDIAGDLGCDFLIVVDSDEYIHPDYQDWKLFDKQLQCVNKYWKDQIFNMQLWIPNEELYPKQHNIVQSEHWQKYARIHKDPGSQRYAQSHYTWTKKGTTDEAINQWIFWHMDLLPMYKDVIDMYKDNPYYLQSNTIIDGVRLKTDRIFRSEQHLEFGDGWAFQNFNWEMYEYRTKPYARFKGIELVEDAPNVKGKKYYFAENKQMVFINDDGTEIPTEMYITVEDPPKK